MIIPDLNDKKEDIQELVKWVVENLGVNTPIHFSAYHPDFKVPSKKRTSYDSLDMAYNLAKTSGLYYVYVDNISHEKGSNTYCPNCQNLIIGRRGYSFTEFNLNDEKECSNCGFNLSNDILGQIIKNNSRTRLF